MSLFLTIAGLTVGFAVVCKLLLTGVRAIISSSAVEAPAVSQPELKVSPARR
jgi:hypothetical protein